MVSTSGLSRNKGRMSEAKLRAITKLESIILPENETLRPTGRAGAGTGITSGESRYHSVRPVGRYWSFMFSALHRVHVRTVAQVRIDVGWSGEGGCHGPIGKGWN